MSKKLSLELIFKQNESKFSEKEKNIAEYILKNVNKVQKFKIVNIKKECKVGMSTIYNFLQKNGFYSIDELMELTLKEKITQSLSNEIEYRSIIEEMYWNIIEKNTQTLDENAINNFISLLSKAKLIYVIGWGESSLAATIFSRRLSRNGFRVTSIAPEREEMITKISTMGKQDLLISLSVSGKTNAILEATQFARKSNIKTISISSNYYPDLKQITDFNISLYTAPFGEQGSGVVYSIIPFIYLLDIVINRLKTKKD